MPRAPGREPGRAPVTIDLRSDRVWPLAIVVALLIVAAVNAAFIWVAVSGADDVVPSYFTEDR